MKIIIGLVLLAFISTASAKEYKYQVGLAKIDQELGDITGIAANVESSSTLLAAEINFKSVDVDGPLAEATFLAKSSNLVFGFSRGEYSASSVSGTLDERIIIIASETFVRDGTVSIGLDINKLDSQDLNISAAHNTVKLGFHREKEKAIYVSFGKDTGDFSGSEIGMETRNIVNINDSALTYFTNIARTNDDDIDASWTDIGLGAIYYPDNSKGIGFEIGKATGDVESNLSYGINAHLFLQERTSLEALFQKTTFDTSDDTSLVLVGLSHRF